MMTQENINKAYEVDTNDAYVSFLSTFTADYDLLVASILTAWLRNDDKDNFFAISKIVKERLKPTPIAFVLNFKDTDEFHDESLYGNVSEKNFRNLILLIKKVTTMQNGVKNTYQNYMESPRHKCKYGHDAMALMFGYNTHFPTTDCKGTFYRYNLLLYWFVYKFRIWDDVDKSKLLLPCNDFIFQRAKELGVTKKKMKSTLSNTIKLTREARWYYGENDFWKMYELLNFYNHDKK